MPPTPATRAVRAVRDDNLTPIQKAALDMCVSAALLWICLRFKDLMVRISKGNYVQRELAFIWALSTVSLIITTLYHLVVFVYHFHGASIRRTIGFFCLWGAISFGLWNLI